MNLLPKGRSPAASQVEDGVHLGVHGDGSPKCGVDGELVVVGALMVIPRRYYLAAFDDDGAKSEGHGRLRNS